MESSDEEDMLTFDTEIISSDQLPAASDPELEEEEEGDVNQTDFETQVLDRSDEVTPPITRKGRPTLLLTRTPRTTPLLEVNQERGRRPDVSKSKSGADLSNSCDEKRLATSPPDTDASGPSPSMETPKLAQKSAADSALISDDDEESLLVAETQATPQQPAQLNNSRLQNSADESILVAETQVTPQQRDSDNSKQQESVDESPDILCEFETQAIPDHGSSPVPDSDNEMATQGFPDLEFESDNEDEVANVNAGATPDQSKPAEHEETIESDSDNDSLLEMDTQGFQEQVIDDSDTEAAAVTNEAEDSKILDMDTQAAEESDIHLDSSSILVPNTQPDRARSNNSTVNLTTDNVEESLLVELDTTEVRVEQADESVPTIEGDLDDSLISEPGNRPEKEEGGSPVAEVLDESDDSNDDILLMQTQAVRFKSPSPEPSTDNEQDDEILAAETQDKSCEQEDLFAAETQAVGHHSADPDDSDLLVAETQAIPNVPDDMLALETRTDLTAGAETCDILAMETQAVPDSDDDEDILLSMQTQAMPAPTEDDSPDSDNEEPAGSILNMETQAVPLNTIEEESNSNNIDSAESILNMQTQAVCLHSSPKETIFDLETQATGPAHSSDQELDQNASAESLLNMQTQAVGIDTSDNSMFDMQTQAVPADDADDIVSDEDILLTMQTQAVPMRGESESDVAEKDIQMHGNPNLSTDIYSDTPDSPTDVFNMPTNTGRHDDSPVKSARPCAQEEESDAATAAKVTVSPLKVGGKRKSILSRRSTGPKLSSADTPVSGSSSVETIVEDSLGEESDSEAAVGALRSPVIALLNTEKLRIPRRSGGQRRQLELRSSTPGQDKGSPSRTGDEKSVDTEVHSEAIPMHEHTAVSSHEQPTASTVQPTPNATPTPTNMFTSSIVTVRNIPKTEILSPATTTSDPENSSKPSIKSKSSRRQPKGNKEVKTTKSSLSAQLSSAGAVLDATDTKVDSVEIEKPVVFKNIDSQESTSGRPTRARRKPQKLMDEETPSTSKTVSKGGTSKDRVSPSQLHPPNNADLELETSNNKPEDLESKKASKGSKCVAKSKGNPAAKGSKTSPKPDVDSITLEHCDHHAGDDKPDILVTGSDETAQTDDDTSREVRSSRRKQNNGLDGLPQAADQSDKPQSVEEPEASVKPTTISTRGKKGTPETDQPLSVEETDSSDKPTRPTRGKRGVTVPKGSISSTGTPTPVNSSVTSHKLARSTRGKKNLGATVKTDTSSADEKAHTHSELTGSEETTKADIATSQSVSKDTSEEPVSAEQSAVYVSTSSTITSENQTMTDSQETGTENLPGAPKSRRGRHLRKDKSTSQSTNDGTATESKTSTDTTVTDSDDKPTTVSISVVQSDPPRGRRGRKANIMVSTDDDIDDAGSSITATGSTESGNTKPTEQSNDTSTSKYADGTSDKQETVDSLANSKPKRRGRPAKAKNSEAVSDNVPECPLVSIPITRTRRESNTSELSTSSTTDGSSRNKTTNSKSSTNVPELSSLQTRNKKQEDNCNTDPLCVEPAIITKRQGSKRKKPETTSTEPSQDKITGEEAETVNARGTRGEKAAKTTDVSSAAVITEPPHMKDTTKSKRKQNRSPSPEPSAVVSKKQLRETRNKTSVKAKETGTSGQETQARRASKRKAAATLENDDSIPSTSKIIRDTVSDGEDNFKVDKEAELAAEPSKEKPVSRGRLKASSTKRNPTKVANQADLTPEELYSADKQSRRRAASSRTSESEAPKSKQSKAEAPVVTAKSNKDKQNVAISTSVTDNVSENPPPPVRSTRGNRQTKLYDKGDSTQVSDTCDMSAPSKPAAGGKKKGAKSKGKTKSAAATPDNDLSEPSISKPPARTARISASQSSVESKPSPAQSPARLSRRLGPSPSNLNSPSHKLRNSTDTPALIKVMFTGIAETAPLEKIVTALGCGVVSDIHKATHLVTDEAKRTIKFMCAVSKGLHIITTKWLTQSKKQAQLLDADKFLLKDKKSEKEYKYSLQQTVVSARDDPQGLLHRYSVHVTKNTKPPPNEIKDIITSAGGRFCSGLPKSKPKSTTSPTDNIIVISCPEDSKTYKPLIQSGYRIVNKEYLLTGVLRHKLEPENFLLH